MKDQIKAKSNQPVIKTPVAKQNPPKEPQSSRVPNKSKPSEAETRPIPHSQQPKGNMQEDLIADLDKTCIFCGEVNEALKDNMDLHYWRNCPILRRCPHCKQVGFHFIFLIDKINEISILWNLILIGPQEIAELSLIFPPFIFYNKIYVFFDYN